MAPDVFAVCWIMLPWQQQHQANVTIQICTVCLVSFLFELSIYWETKKRGKGEWVIEECTNAVKLSSAPTWKFLSFRCKWNLDSAQKKILFGTTVICSQNSTWLKVSNHRCFLSCESNKNCKIKPIHFYRASCFSHKVWWHIHLSIPETSSRLIYYSTDRKSSDDS